MKTIEQIKVPVKRFNLKNYILVSNFFNPNKINKTKKEYKSKGYTDFIITEHPREDCNLPQYKLWAYSKDDKRCKK